MDRPGGGAIELEIVHRDSHTEVRFLGDFSVEEFQRRAAAASRA